MDNEQRNGMTTRERAIWDNVFSLAFVSGLPTPEGKADQAIEHLRELGEPAQPDRLGMQVQHADGRVAFYRVNVRTHALGALQFIPAEPISIAKGDVMQFYPEV